MPPRSWHFKRRLTNEGTRRCMIFILFSTRSCHEGGASSGLHALKFTDGVLLLSESRLLLLATKLNLLGDTIVKTAAAVEAAGFPTLRALAASFAESSGRPDTCAWNLLLKRRQVSISIVATRTITALMKVFLVFSARLLVRLCLEYDSIVPPFISPVYRDAVFSQRKTTFFIRPCLQRSGG